VGSRGSVTVVDVLDRVNTQLILVEQWHDKFGIVTVGKHEQEIFRSHELEARESLFLAVHELVQRGLADFEFGHYFPEFDVKVRCDAKVFDVLGLHAYL